MEPNLSEDMVWYADSLMGMVDTRAQIKKKEESEVKDEPKNSVYNQSIRFHKALQTFQHITPDQMERVMKKVQYSCDSTPQDYP